MTTRLEAKEIMHYAIMILIMAAFYVLPTPAAVVTPYGMKVLGVFIGLIYGWTFIGMLVPSLLGVFGLAIAGVGSTQEVFMNLFYNANILMMIIGSLGFATLVQTNATDYIFGKILSTNFAKKSGMLTVMCMLAVVLILGALGTGILLNFVLFPIMNDFLKKCGYSKGDRFSNMFLIGYFVAACMPIGIFPFYSWGLMICGSLQSVTQTVLPIAPYMGLNILIFILFIVTYPIMMKVAGCDFSKLQNVDVLEAFNVDSDTKLTAPQKVSLGSLLVFLAVVLICSFVNIPAIQAFYAKIGVLGLMLMFWIVMMLVKVDGKPLLDMRKASQDMSWDLCILMATALVLSSAMTSADSGIGTWLAMLISPLVSGLDQIAFLAVLCAVLIFLTNLANNIAVVFILINLVAALVANGMEVNMTVVAIILSMGSATVAFFTPASSLVGAILHSAEMTSTKGLYVLNWVAAIYLFVIMMIVLIPAALLGIGA